MSDTTIESIISKWEKLDGEHKHFEEVLGDKALEWVNLKNDQVLSSNQLGKPNNNDNDYKRILNILNSKEKIAHVRKIGNYAYNFWQGM